MNRKFISKYFHEITGNQPYNFQISVINKILQGQNLILQAPTGSGKTWAVIVPFIMSLCENYSFPRKIIYSLPLRVLANSLFDTVNQNRFVQTKGIPVTLQTGEQPNDKCFLDGDIIFTTIDQSLSSMLSIPLSLPLRQANINAGAVISSYLVFDEFHLLQPELSLSTLFYLLKKLKGITPFCLMTATLSKKLLDTFAKELGAEIVCPISEEVKQIKSQKDKVRTIHAMEHELSADDILSNHPRGSRSIVICNRVARCQQIFRDVQKKAPKNTTVLCIHSRFFGRHRKAIEKELQELFGRDSNADAILIATQVVEVGIDISCDVMHTEISPINSLLQRIGRCARFEAEQGKVFVYTVDSFMPYQQDLSQKTFEELQKINGENLDYSLGQKIIDAVLAEKELLELRRIQASDREEKIREVWSYPEKARAYELIREIDSIRILLHDNPQAIRNPYGYETVSMHKWTLLSSLDKIEIDDEDWLIRAVRESNFIDDDLDNENLTSRSYSYDRISTDEARKESLLILNSAYIYYSPEIGLNFLGVGKQSSQTLNKQEKEKDFAITKDSYQEHVSYLMKAYEKYFRGRLQYTFAALLKRLELDLPIDDLMAFMIVMHDFGKLNKRWQQIASQQQSKKENFIQGELLAHTDFDAHEDVKVRFPPHAGVGAFAALTILEQQLLQLGIGEENIITIVKAVFTSILRHHSAYAFKSQEYSIVSDGVKITRELMQEFADTFANFAQDFDALMNWHSEDLRQFIVQFDDDRESLFYFLLVRILRVCDQMSFEMKN